MKPNKVVTPSTLESAQAAVDAAQVTYDTARDRLSKAQTAEAACTDESQIETLSVESKKAEAALRRATGDLESATQALAAAQREARLAEMIVHVGKADEETARATLAKKIAEIADLSTKLRAAVDAAQAIVDTQRSEAEIATAIGQELGVSSSVAPLPARLVTAYCAVNKIAGYQPATLESVQSLCECAEPNSRPADWKEIPAFDRLTWALDGSFNRRAREHDSKVKEQAKAFETLWAPLRPFMTRHGLLNEHDIRSHMMTSALEVEDEERSKEARGKVKALQTMIAERRYPTFEELKAYCVSDGTDLTWLPVEKAA